MFYTTVDYCMNHMGTDDKFQLHIFIPPQKGRFALIQAKKTQWGSGGIALFTHHLGA